MMMMLVMIVHMQNTWISVIEQLPAAVSGGWPGPHAKALGGIILGSISQDFVQSKYIPQTKNVGKMVINCHLR